jgi:hypothetical protein
MNPYFISTRDGTKLIVMANTQEDARKIAKDTGWRFDPTQTVYAVDPWYLGAFAGFYRLVAPLS